MNDALTRVQTKRHILLSRGRRYNILRNIQLRYRYYNFNVKILDGLNVYQHFSFTEC